MSYRVKRLEPETVIVQHEVRPGVVAGIKSPKSVTWAVCDENGNVLFDKNILTGKSAPSIWPSKRVAEKVAGY